MIREDRFRNIYPVIGTLVRTNREASRVALRSLRQENSYRFETSLGLREYKPAFSETTKQKED